VTGFEELEALAGEAGRRLHGLAEEFVVLARGVEREMLKLARGEASVVQSWNSIEFGVYVARRDGRLLFTELSTSSPGDAVESVARLVERLEPSPLYAPLPRATGESYSLVDPAIARHLSGEERLDLAHDIELELLGDVAGMASLSRTRLVLLNSHGERLRGDKTAFTGYLRVFRGGRSGQWSWAHTGYDGGRPARRAAQAARELAEECQGLPAERVEPGRYRVLLSPMVAGNLVDELVGMANGASILFGMSFIRPDTIGERVFSEALTIVDAPRDASLPGYSLFDDEGVATRDKAVVRRGVLETVLHNSKTAKAMGAETTGNAGLLMPRPFSIVVEPGDLGSDELLEALGNGVYVTNNWYTRFQSYPEGAFSTVTRDAVFIVRGGRPVACTGRIRIADRLGELFSRVEAAGREAWRLEWWEIPVPSLVPHLLVGEAGITTA